MDKKSKRQSAQRDGFNAMVRFTKEGGRLDRNPKTDDQKKQYVLGLARLRGNPGPGK